MVFRGEGVLLGLLTVTMAGCPGDDEGRRVQETETGLPTAGSATVTSGDSATGSMSQGSASTGLESTTGMPMGTDSLDDTGFKFDFAIPDGGGDPPLPTIPETCAQALLVQSTVGCSFHANKMQNFIEEPTSLVVGNVSEDMPATLHLYQGVSGMEQQVEGPIMVAPGQTHEFILNSPSEPGDVSVLRDGGAYRVESDVPVVAYQHSPISAEAHNDSSMLLPDHAQGQYFIIASWETNIGTDRSYFNVVGLEDGTTVDWEPPVATLSGTGVPAVTAGGMGQVMLDHFDTLQVTTDADISGTIVSTSAPAWVVGAVPCVNIPAGVTYCDHIEEQMLPLEYWGQEYVGAHAPTRGSEDYYWRIYSGDDAITVTTDPPQPNTPVVLDRGQFVEFATQESFMITADGPIMPVQYLEGQDGGAGTGDPASYQMVPVEQFLPRYVFVTGTGYNLNYVQVIRPAGAAEVFVDGAMVTGYYTVGNFEVADWQISEGAHLAESDDPFGVIQIGYTAVTSYAYPGGLRLATINPNPEG